MYIASEIKWYQIGGICAWCACVYTNMPQVCGETSSEASVKTNRQNLLLHSPPLLADFASGGSVGKVGVGDKIQMP